jgi:hypothetical protein
MSENAVQQNHILSIDTHTFLPALNRHCPCRYDKKMHTCVRGSRGKRQHTRWHPIGQRRQWRWRRHCTEVFATQLYYAVRQPSLHSSAAYCALRRTTFEWFIHQALGACVFSVQGCAAYALGGPKSQSSFSTAQRGWICTRMPENGYFFIVAPEVW